MRRKKSTKKGGQFLLEFALILPFFMLIVVGGMIDFGFIFNNLLTLQEVANKAAQFGARQAEPESTSSDSMVKYLTGSYCNRIVPKNWTMFSATVDIRNGASANYRVVEVVTTYNSPVFTPFWATMVTAVSGEDTAVFPLTARATYQVPKFFRD
ncbi:MAG: pilus assembly protein [Candidatus Riflebacteria bacterium]|nr:pilus assembly protein [Candidatus Riflebacteria bacterium]